MYVARFNLYCSLLYSFLISTFGANHLMKHADFDDWNFKVLSSESHLLFSAIKGIELYIL